MGTQFRIQLIGYDRHSALTAARVAFKEVERIERKVSSWQTKSEIGQLNQQAGQSSVSLSYESAWLLCQGRRIAQQSGGAFDVTWAALKGLWDFKNHHVPTFRQVKDRLQWVGSKHLTIRRGAQDACKGAALSHPPPPWTRSETPKHSAWSLYFNAQLQHPQSQIDLGGIAKGYGVDQAALILKRFGYTDFLIDGGGDLLVEGRAIDEKPWTIGIAHPRTSQPWGQIWIPSGWSVVTSGDYERFFIKNETRYHHIIDLRTGYPARDSVAVTVIARGAMRADAYATAIFVLGAREGLALAESLPDLEAIILDSVGDVHQTHGATLFSTSLRTRWRE